MLELILADQLADLTPLVVASSGPEWQFYISTIRAHSGRSTGRSTPLVLASSGPEWQFYISTIRAHTGGSIPPALHARHHGMYIVGYIWQPLWILQEKVGICLYL